MNVDERSFCPRCNRDYESMEVMLEHLKKAHADYDIEGWEEADE